MVLFPPCPSPCSWSPAPSVTPGPWSQEEMTRLQAIVKEHLDAKQRAEQQVEGALMAAEAGEWDRGRAGGGRRVARTMG